MSNSSSLSGSKRAMDSNQILLQTIVDHEQFDIIKQLRKVDIFVEIEDRQKDNKKKYFAKYFFKNCRDHEIIKHVIQIMEKVKVKLDRGDGN